MIILGPNPNGVISPAVTPHPLASSRAAPKPARAAPATPEKLQQATLGALEERLFAAVPSGVDCPLPPPLSSIHPSDRPGICRPNALPRYHPGAYRDAKEVCDAARSGITKTRSFETSSSSSTSSATSSSGAAAPSLFNCLPSTIEACALVFPPTAKGHRGRKIKAARKVTTVRAVAEGGWASLDLAWASDRAAEALGTELLAFAAKQSRLFAFLASREAAEEISAPVLAWELLVNTYDEGCLDLIFYTSFAELGDLEQRLQDLARGQGLEPGLAAATAASAPHLDGPPLDWAEVSSLLLSTARLAQTETAAGIVPGDLKPRNWVVPRGGRPLDIDCDGTHLLHLTPAQAAALRAVGDGGVSPLWPHRLAWHSQALRCVPVTTLTDCFAAPEMVGLCEAERLVAARASGDAAATDRLLEAPRLEPALARLAERGVLQSAAAAELRRLNGGWPGACIATVTWLWGAGTRESLAQIRAVLASRARAGGWGGLGAENEAMLGRLEALCGACCVLQPSARPSMAWVARQLVAACQST
ncbi:hypothetical protein HYH03_013712 [Edaphochlamys debaryana]|uniref:Uncharacterized protein n=1 Tax=Edaphochlamys debaryana TaxID=47281 RepID=A0A835XPA3_9CHLO|nr:hypothetical protein HYH03_013712 [Edaphochlamys debaryana]|eukprot:KAG2487713.1 hypothetical protein HYH03_013712 [Edaphochlamys debaryana]